MRLKYFIAVGVITLSIIGQSARAQKKKVAMPENGTWQLVYLKTEKNPSTVRFFNRDGALIYEENVKSAKLDISKKKTLVKLNAALQQALKMYELKVDVKAEENWVAELLNKKTP
jgi:hypothetical protein